MVDNLALVISHSLMLFVIWRILKIDDGDTSRKTPIRAAMRKPGTAGRDIRPRA